MNMVSAHLHTFKKHFFTFSIIETMYNLLFLFNCYFVQVYYTNVFMRNILIVIV